MNVSKSWHIRHCLKEKFVSLCKTECITLMAISGNVAINTDLPPNKIVQFNDLEHKSVAFEWLFSEEAVHPYRYYGLEVFLTGELYAAHIDDSSYCEEEFWQLLNQKEM